MIAELALALSLLSADRPAPPAVLQDLPVVAQPASMPPGLREFADGELKWLLYVPPDWKPRRRFPLTIHFHTAWWLSLPKHLDAGLAGPLLIFNNGAGSLRYQRPFEDRGRLQRWLDQIESEVGVEPGALSVSSFSAGYGAVREILQSPRYFHRIRRVALLDSLYGDLDDAQPVRTPAPSDVEPWLPLAREAAAGRKQFLVTLSEVPTPYASSSEVGQAIVEALGGRLERVWQGGYPGRGWPLLARYDRGGLHVWLYQGGDGPAHMAHTRNLARFWSSLNPPDKRY